MSVSTNRLFTRFPWLFIALAIFLIANNYFNWFPNQVLQSPTNYIVPGVLTWFGIMGYLMKWYESRKK